MPSLLPDEKTTPVMLYTAAGAIRGELVTKSAVRVTTFLRTEGAEGHLRLLRAQMLLFYGGPHSQSFTELSWPTCDILAFHLLPPAVEPLDYDESEKNRVMQPVMLLVGTFHFAGKLRISSASDLATSLAAVRTGWMSVYEVSIKNPLLPQMNPLQVPMAVVRPARVGLASST